MGRIGESRFLPPPPRPLYPTREPVQRLNRIMVHAFLSASLQDNLWNSEWKTIKAFTHAPIIACKQALCYSGLNSGWFSTDQKYIHFTRYKNAYLSISCKHVEIKICFQKIDKMEGAAFIENSNLRKLFLYALHHATCQN